MANDANDADKPRRPIVPLHYYLDFSDKPPASEAHDFQRLHGFSSPSAFIRSIKEQSMLFGMWELYMRRKKRLSASAILEPFLQGREGKRSRPKDGWCCEDEMLVCFRHIRTGETALQLARALRHFYHPLEEKVVLLQASGMRAALIGSSTMSPDQRSAA